MMVWLRKAGNSAMASSGTSYLHTPFVSQPSSSAVRHFIWQDTNNNNRIIHQRVSLLILITTMLQQQYYSNQPQPQLI